jgi:hypothetical protein
MRRGLCARASVAKETNAQAVNRRLRRNFAKGFALSILHFSTIHLRLRARKSKTKIINSSPSPPGHMNQPPPPLL